MTFILRVCVVKYLVKNLNDTYYVRIRVCSKLIKYFRQREISKSLRTRNLKQAKAITFIKGDIKAYDDETESPVLIGKIQLYYCDMLSACINGRSLFEVMDGHSATLEEFFAILYNPTTEEMKPFVSELLDIEIDECDKNILIFNRIEILPDYRGHGITKQVVNHCIRLFSNNCNVISLQCYPLQLSKLDEEDIDDIQWHNSLQLDKLEQDKKKAQKSLSSYYKSLGFIRIPRTNFMLIKK